jgi:hypothetical protein
VETRPLLCARCTRPNLETSRFCDRCGLPLGAPEADASAVHDVFGASESPEPGELPIDRALHELAARSGFEAQPFGSGWCLSVELPLDRRQAVFLGPAHIDAAGRTLLGLVSVCGPANERDTRTLLKLNARMADAHFAIRVLRGEEYFVVIQHIGLDQAGAIDIERLVESMARLADGLEDRLTRGRDRF